MKKKLTLALFGFLLIAYASFGQHRQNMLTLDERINLSEVIIECEVIEKESYFDHSDNEIYTINRIKIYKQFKGNYLPDEISLITAGGQVGDTIERVFHSFQVSLGTKGVFFFKQSRINHPLNDFPNQTQEVISTHGFIRYYSVDYSENLVAGSAYEDFDNIEVDLLQEIERKVGKKRTVKNLTNKEQTLQDWINSNSFTKNGNGNGSIVEYTIANPSLTGAFNEFLEFDINIASLLNSEEFFSGELLIDYNSLTFGSNLAASGIITITKGNVIVTPNYTITVSDVTSSKLKIEVTSSSNNPNTLYLIDNTADQLVHLKIDITNLAGSTGISFDEINMQGASEFFDISSNVVEPFELVKADDELNVDVNALIVPQIDTIYPLSVRGGVDTITIEGTGFGNNQYTGHVQFTNALKGPSFMTWITAHPSDYVLWTDTQIKVKVTSYGRDVNGDYGNFAGTGQIRVQPDLGPVSNPSDSTLNVIFSISNDLYSDNGVFKTVPVILIDGNNVGGYTITFDTSFTDNVSYPGAQDAFKRALVTWRCETGVNFSINDTFPNQPIGNEIVVKFGTPFNAALASTGEWIIPDCSGSLNAYLRKFSMTYNRNEPYKWHTSISTLIPLVPFEYDFETITLHELGHAHQLNHSNGVNNTMWWAPPNENNPYHRNLDMTAKLGGLYVMDISSNNPPPSGSCLNPMLSVSPFDCDFINNTNDVHYLKQVSIFPNPASNSLRIEISNFNINNSYNYFLYDLFGQILNQGNIVSSNETIDISNYPTGVYIVKIIRDDNAFLTKKIIKTQ